jgi:hypothetical protein
MLKIENTRLPLPEDGVQSDFKNPNGHTIKEEFATGKSF